MIARLQAHWYVTRLRVWLFTRGLRYRLFVWVWKAIIWPMYSAYSGRVHTMIEKGEVCPEDFNLLSLDSDTERDYYHVR